MSQEFRRYSHDGKARGARNVPRPNDYQQRGWAREGSLNTGYKQTDIASKIAKHRFKIRK